MSKITVTRALATLKTLDKRISKAVNGAAFANYTVGGKPEIEAYTPAEDLQSIQDLIDYRSALKSGIMKSNATTKVKIGDEKMTVVQAIETKDSIKYKKLLLKKIQSDLRTVDSYVEDINQDVQRRLDQHVSVILGKDGKSTEAEIAGLTDPFLKKNEAKSVDSQKYRDIAEKMEEEVDTFIAEVDLVLSESNATTTIEI